MLHAVLHGAIKIFSQGSGFGHRSRRGNASTVAEHRGGPKVQGAGVHRQAVRRQGSIGNGPGAGGIPQLGRNDGLGKQISRYNCAKEPPDCSEREAHAVVQPRA